MREVRLLARARADAERIAGWWRSNRTAAPTLFQDELARALELLRERPEVSAVFGERHGEMVRRHVLPESRAHVYYVVRPERVIVLRIWSAVRDRPPSLG